MNHKNHGLQSFGSATQAAQPAFIMYHDEAWELTSIDARGTLSVSQADFETFTETGHALLGDPQSTWLKPLAFSPEKVTDEACRLRRTSPLSLIRLLQERCQAAGRHFFCALSFEAAHIFDDLPHPKESFASFIIAQATRVDKAALLQKHGNSVTDESTADQAAPSFKLLEDTSPEFLAMLEKARKHFRVGDIFEIVLSRRFRFEALSGDPYPFLAGEVLQLKAPYRFALPFAGVALVGASPELLVHVENQTVVNRPISGSMRRNPKPPGTSLENTELSAEERIQLERLYASEKEKSELDMLIDLARHDLHRVCTDVCVSQYREALVLETVVHTQATVTGQLKPDRDALDAVFSCLNAGTLVGAPKKKAMEILARLEGNPRRFYGGNLIHTLPDGRLRATILIRTFQVEGPQVTLQAGATVLHESAPDYEFWECGSKAQRLLQIVGYGHLAHGQGVPPPIDDRTSPVTGPFRYLSSFGEGIARETSDSGEQAAASTEPVRLLLVDNHDSFTFNLAALFESLGCTVQVVRNDQDLPPSSTFDAIVLSPGPSAPRDAGALLAITSNFWQTHPMFGVCLGFQAMVEARGGQLGVMDKPLHGKARNIHRQGHCRFLDGLPETFVAARYHSLFGEVMPGDLRVTARDDEGRPMALSAGSEAPPHCGVQFHPESFMSGTAGVRIACNWLAAVKEHKAHKKMGVDLGEIESILKAMLEEPPTQDFLAGSLEGLRAETLAELVRRLRPLAQKPEPLQELAQVAVRGGHALIEICGTGGTRSHRLNTSTLTALMAAASGALVIKHGGRSASGHKGSLDLLEHLGLAPQKLFEQAAEGWRQTGVAFLGAAFTYAPFGRYASTRKAFGQPSIFNLLGPLLGPVTPTFRLVGCFDEARLMLLADTLALLGEDGAVVLGHDSEGYIDEIHPFGHTRYALVSKGRIRYGQLAPVTTSPGSRTALFEKSLAVATDLLAGHDTTETRAGLDFVLVNTAFLLAATQGKAQPQGSMSSDALKETYTDLKRCARDLLARVRRIVTQLSGLSPIDARSPLAGLKPAPEAEPRRTLTLSAGKAPIAATEAWPVGQRAQALARHATNSGADTVLQAPDKGQGQGLIIAEIKVRTPQKELASSLDVAAQVRAYTAGGAQAISVVTHPQFGGSPELLAAVRQLTPLPILAKDFLCSAEEATRLVRAGADAVLVLEDWLGTERSAAMAIQLAQEGVLPVVESTLRRPGGGLPAELPYIALLNTRNLFNLELGSAFRQSLAQQHPDVVVASDLATPLEAAVACSQNRGVLVGEALIKNGPEAAEQFLKDLVLLSRKAQQRQLIKACGAQNLAEVLTALAAGADLVGINLVPASRRCIGIKALETLLDSLGANPALAQRLVFLTHAESAGSAALKRVAERYLSHLNGCWEQPYHWPLLGLAVASQQGPAARNPGLLSPLRRHNAFHGAEGRLTVPWGSQTALLDGPHPGSGRAASYPPCPAHLRHLPVFIAGGITPDTAETKRREACAQGWHVIGIDAATGVAGPGGVGLCAQKLALLVGSLAAAPTAS